LLYIFFSLGNNSSNQIQALLLHFFSARQRFVRSLWHIAGKAISEGGEAA
jgi:hypothetical protein